MFAARTTAVRNDVVTLRHVTFNGETDSARVGDVIRTHVETEPGSRRIRARFSRLFWYLHAEKQRATTLSAPPPATARERRKSETRARAERRVPESRAMAAFPPDGRDGRAVTAPVAADRVARVVPLPVARGLLLHAAPETEHRGQAGRPRPFTPARLSPAIRGRSTTSTRPNGTERDEQDGRKSVGKQANNNNKRKTEEPEKTTGATVSTASETLLHDSGRQCHWL